MSSAEIAELVESRHDSVKRTIERLRDRGVIDVPPMVEDQMQTAYRRRRFCIRRMLGFAGEAQNSSPEKPQGDLPYDQENQPDQRPLF